MNIANSEKDIQRECHLFSGYFTGGQWRASGDGKTISDINPCDGSVSTEFGLATRFTLANDSPKFMLGGRMNYDIARLNGDWIFPEFTTKYFNHIS